MNLGARTLEPLAIIMINKSDIKVKICHKSYRLMNSENTYSVPFILMEKLVLNYAGFKLCSL